MIDFDTEIWRPDNTSGPICLYLYNDDLCTKHGAHHCSPRAQRFIDFCSTFLRHYAGPLARQPFDLTDWQEDEIARPLFGEVVWSFDWNRYVRRYRTFVYVVPRKQGKSNLCAAFALYLLIGDFEESSNVYCAAKDRDQAGMVFNPARRMVELSPELRCRLKLNKAVLSLRDDGRHRATARTARDLRPQSRLLQPLRPRR
jgi:phage terminase large subunit-like protein